MLTFNKPLMRLATLLHTKLVANERTEPLIELPQVNWQRCYDVVRQIRRARLRGWNLAAAVLSGDLLYAIPSLQHELTALQNRLRSQRPVSQIASTIDVYRDLLVLAEEFEEFTYDHEAQALSGTTQSIDLNGVYLGPFEIRLKFIRGDPAYRVIAKDPHPPESRENVTHPHVMDDVLCEGDARHSIRQALAQGRLLDFFTLLATVLRTYNPESPFVELALWQGVNCSDCGASVDDEDAYSCSRCGSTVCAECELLCRGCEESCCSSCIGGCAVCDEPHCPRCLTNCETCRRRVCAGCLTENERCTVCHEETIENPNREPSGGDGLAVQPCGLGQAPLSA